MVLAAILLVVAAAVYGREYLPAMTGILEDRVKRFAVAIATAEGFYAQGDNIPKSRNNPGNLKWFKADVAANVVSTFPTEAAGWEALYKQIRKMFGGVSALYQPSMTLEEIARTYTGEAAYMNWAVNVARVLGGISTKTKLGDVA